MGQVETSDKLDMTVSSAFFLWELSEARSYRETAEEIWISANYFAALLYVILCLMRKFCSITDVVDSEEKHILDSCCENRSGFKKYLICILREIEE